MVKVKGWISYHEYGTRAADSCSQSAIEKIFSLPLIDAVGAAIALNNDSVLQAVIAWNGFDENLDDALKIIRSAAYMQAHFHLNDLIMIEREEAARISDLWLDEFPVYPNTVNELQPSPIISMVEILNESSMPTHAPTAAATSELQTSNY
jgi:hypothetical protein